MLNYDALESAVATLDPYPHAVIANFVSDSDVLKIIADYPKLDMGGLFLPEGLSYGPAFAEVLQELESERFRAGIGKILGLDLTGLPTMITVRGCAQAKDGRIHADSKFKVASLLLYFNEPWASGEGRLRILRSPTDINDYAAELPPNGGTLVLFKVQDNGWHGHTPLTGVRRYIMVNYCTDQAKRDKEYNRHKLSGRLKRALRLLGIGKITNPTITQPA